MIDKIPNSLKAKLKGKEKELEKAVLALKEYAKKDLGEQKSMTDKVQKNQIADILLDFYEEYHSNEINRPMIPSIYAGKIIDSLQEEPVSIWHDASEKPERENLLIETNDGRIIHRQSINNYGMVKRWAYISVLLNLDNSCNFGKNSQEEPVSDRFVFKAIPRLLEMIESSERAKSYVTKLADAFDVEGYHTDAEIVRESLKMMNGEKVAMATMDEEPVSEEVDKDDSFDELLQELYIKYNKEVSIEKLLDIASNFVKWQKQIDALTWEDIPKILSICENLKTSWWFRDNEQTKKIGKQPFWEEVLKRFKAQKGEMDYVHKRTD